MYPVLLALFAFISMSCSTNLGTGIIAGGTIGGGGGGIAGGTTGGLIGSAAGIVAGGLIGALLDEQDQKVIEKTSPRTLDRMEKGEPLSINDVIKLSQGGVSDPVIIEYLKETNASYSLTHSQIKRMRESGVSQRVIHFMTETNE